MVTVRNLMARKKSQEVFSLTATDSVFMALQLMDAHNIGSVLVMRGSSLAGIVTEQDIARKMYRIRLDPMLVYLESIMTESNDLVIVSPDTNLEEALILMDQHKIRHLIVAENEMPTAVISIRDVLEAMLNDTINMLSMFERFVTGENPQPC